MSDINEMLVEQFTGLVASISPPSQVRAAESPTTTHPMWQQIAESGFLDLLVPEDMGGAGLTLDSLFLLAVVAGEHALPVPFAETAMARGLLAAGGASAPDDAVIVLAPSSNITPLAAGATHALIQKEQELCLVTLSGEGLDPFSAGAEATLTPGEAIASIPMGSVDLLATAAALTAANMAGGMVKLQQMSNTYAGERQQFGRPLGKFQAIQQQLAVMAEQVASAYIAARIGLSGDQVVPVRAAMAKCRVSEAAHQVSAIAHAVHGAIGATEEYDLQLYSRRLKQGQLAFGSESYWALRLADARLGTAEINSADFVRLNLQELAQG
ncbi:MAG: acyl-CoA dehydrogenase family protein [Erythrobacter sp.]